MAKQSARTVRLNFCTLFIKNCFNMHGEINSEFFSSKCRKERMPLQIGFHPTKPPIALCLTCKTWTNYMIIFRFQWHFNGQKLNGNDVSLIISPDAFSSSLSFTSLRTSHSGNYTCEADNAASSDKYSSHLLVNGDLWCVLWSS